MGYENQGYESREQMETLVLDEPSNGHHLSDHRSVVYLDEAPRTVSPPAAVISAVDDPLASSSSPSAVDRQNPNLPFNSFLEPPSYADVIFKSFDESNGDINGHGSPKSLPRSASSSSEYLHISVTEPQMEQEMSNSLVPGGNTYVTYLITTRTNLPEFGGPGSESSVRRRFKDVVTLSDRLSESYRGFFIPVRPDKSVVESQVMQKQEFVEQRRSALEKYLRRLAGHPEIKKSEELRVFLQVEGKLPLPRSTDVASRMLDGAVKLPKQLFGESTALANPHEVMQPAKGGRDLLRIFRELKQAVSNDWGGSKPPVVEEDKEFLERKDKLMDFEQQLSNVSQQVDSFSSSISLCGYRFLI